MWRPNVRYWEKNGGVQKNREEVCNACQKQNIYFEGFCHLFGCLPQCYTNCRKRGQNSTSLQSWWNSSGQHSINSRSGSLGANSQIDQNHQHKQQNLSFQNFTSFSFYLNTQAYGNHPAACGLQSHHFLHERCRHGHERLCSLNFKSFCVGKLWGIFTWRSENFGSGWEDADWTWVQLVEEGVRRGQLHNDQPIGCSQQGCWISWGQYATTGNYRCWR